MQVLPGVNKKRPGKPDQNGMCEWCTDTGRHCNVYSYITNYSHKRLFPASPPHLYGDSCSNVQVPVNSRDDTSHPFFHKMPKMCRNFMVETYFVFRQHSYIFSLLFAYFKNGAAVHYKILRNCYLIYDSCSFLGHEHVQKVARVVEVQPV